MLREYRHSHDRERFKPWLLKHYDLDLEPTRTIRKSLSEMTGRGLHARPGLADKVNAITGIVADPIQIPERSIETGVQGLSFRGLAV